MQNKYFFLTFPAGHSGDLAKEIADCFMHDWNQKLLVKDMKITQK